MKIQKSVINSLNTKEDLKLFVPITLIALGEDIFPLEHQKNYTTSIYTLWTIATNGERKPTKKEREELVGLFSKYLKRENIDFYENITFNSSNGASFVPLHLTDIVKIFKTTKRIETVGTLLFFLVNIHSYLDGSCIYRTHSFLVEEFKHDYIDDKSWDKEKSETWFRKYDADQLVDVKKRILCYPCLETLAIKKHNSDSIGFKEPIMTRSGVTHYLDILKELGMIHRFSVSWGEHGSKLVFCREEHKLLAESLCSRIESQKIFFA